MAISAQRFTVSTTPVALNAAAATHIQLRIKNTSANPADLGPSNVAAGAGFDLAAGATIDVQVAVGEIIYAIRSGASDATLAVLRT